jgi:hypothetical protein
MTNLMPRLGPRLSLALSILGAVVCSAIGEVVVLAQRTIP